MITSVIHVSVYQYSVVGLSCLHSFPIAIGKKKRMKMKTKKMKNKRKKKTMKGKKRKKKMKK